MLSFHDAAEIAAAPSIVSNPKLKQLLADRVHDWAATDLLGLTHLLIVQPGDSEQAILDEVAFSPLVNTLNNSRFGSADFRPPFDWLQDHGGWFELIFTVGNSGFAFVLFVEDAEGVEPALLSLCRTYAEQNAEADCG